MSTLKVAAANYPIGYHASWQAYSGHVEQWVDDAQQGGAELLLFPEYGAMELCSLLPTALQQDLHGQIHALQAFVPAFTELYSELAQRYGVTLLAPSLPVQLGSRPPADQGDFG